MVGNKRQALEVIVDVTNGSREEQTRGLWVRQKAEHGRLGQLPGASPWVSMGSRSSRGC